MTVVVIFCPAQSRPVHVLFPGGADYCWSRFPETGVEESDEEYVEYQMWSCKQSDGKEAAQNSCVGPRMRITKKYIWVQNKLHWYEAQRYCEERHNGRMFGELDGSYEQIEFLFSKLGENSMWLGITKAPFTHQWKTLSGIDVTEVLTGMWAPGQPDEPPMNKKIVILFDEYYTTDGQGLTFRRPFICSLPPSLD